MSTSSPKNRTIRLTKREKDFVQLFLVENLLFKECASRMGVSIKTAEKHAQNLYKMIETPEARNRCSLLRLCFKHGFIKCIDFITFYGAGNVDKALGHEQPTGHLPSPAPVLSYEVPETTTKQKGKQTYAKS